MLNVENIIKLAAEQIEAWNTAEYRKESMRQYRPIAEYTTDLSIAKDLAELAYLRVLLDELRK
jgi:hypothetical protein